MIISDNSFGISGNPDSNCCVCGFTIQNSLLSKLVSVYPYNLT